MKVMLRFGERDQELEQRLRDEGATVILPRRRRDHGNPPDFFALVCEEGSVGTKLATIEQFLQRHAAALASYAQRHGDGPCLDWGFSCDEDFTTLVANLRFPPKLLSSLASLDIALNVSIYVSWEQMRGDKNEDQSGGE